METQEQLDNQNPISDPDTTGKNDVILNDDELEELSEEELRKQLKTIMYQKKHFRDKYSKVNEELQKLKESMSNQQAPTQQEKTVDVEAAARKVAMDMKRDELLLEVPEDKRESVKEFYNAISNGKSLDITSVNLYMQAAMRAAGVETKVNSANYIITNSSGAVPPRTPPGPTPEQIEIAKKFGNDPAKVYDEKIDLSGMLNPEKFFTNEKKELI